MEQNMTAYQRIQHLTAVLNRYRHEYYNLNAPMVTVGYYVGTTTCRNCMEEYCSQTNCLGCKRGTYPDCKYQYLKRKPIVMENDIDEEEE